MEKNIRLSKPLKIQIFIVVCIFLLFVFLVIYCIIFQWYNDKTKETYDLTYLENIYNQDKDLFNSCADWINENDILVVSHHRYHLSKIQNSVLNNTLYYEYGTSYKRLNNYYKVEKIFNKFDFDLIEKDDNRICFSYFSPSIQLVYSEESMKDCKQISDFWYIEYIK